MARYIIKFSKTGEMKFISHLDMMRLFRRTFKRAGIMIAYSQGFNPHAKISLGQPLSLGYESTGEYMEMETDGDYEPEKIKGDFNRLSPPGVNVEFCGRLKETSNSAKNTVAASIGSALYEIVSPWENGTDEAVSEDEINAFAAQDEILAEKMKKKKVGRGKTVRVPESVDIKQHIREFGISDNAGQHPDGKIRFKAVLATGSSGNLNPETLAGALCGYLGRPYDKHLWRFTRIEMYDLSGSSMEVFKG